MIVSWNWLRDYVSLECTPRQAAERLMMSGLNLEEIQACGDDFAIDLEVTSNRADCLGQIGVARELSALFHQPLRIPEARIEPVATATATITSVENRCPDHCAHYTARIIRGVKVGPSPDWLKHRLECLGLRSVNNVVDVTNYVLMECGQPLHAFDFQKLSGQRIVVRLAKPGEKILAIDGREYELDNQTCVIADAERPAAIAGVMGGQLSEVTEQTTDLLIEAAQFAPLSVRRTARKLSLFSDSSFRFERGINRQQLDWASRRCCELIVQLAGGEILNDPITVPPLPEHVPVQVTLRFASVPRLLGIPVSPAESRGILKNLGLVEIAADDRQATYQIPSWRADLPREVDLIEEVARIHGYEKISENDAPRVTAAQKSKLDRTTDLVHRVFNAQGYFEAMTLTFTSEEESQSFNPRRVDPLLRVDHSSRRRENVLRPSLIPSLLVSRRANERTGTANARLYEIARVFTALSTRGAAQSLMIGTVTGDDFLSLKGLLEQLVGEVSRDLELTAHPCDYAGFAAGRGAELYLNDLFWGWLGELDRNVSDRFDLKDAVTVAEVDLDPLVQHLEQAPQLQRIPQFPAIERDFNFLLEERITWQELAGTITSAGGELLRNLAYAGQYRGEKIGVGKKTYLARAAFRSDERTLTGEEVDTLHKQIVTACEQKLSAILR
ncbi:MAG: phenylalanine--tRNA ligase subunit beta [Planctomycetaceae bacterium]|nr:phenylalanine--tRNA ligase subunit beta [Planctomycetaceae bacterium]